MSQMHKELSFENELKELELVISNLDENYHLLSTNEKQRKVPKKNSHLRGDVIALKALSDKAWENDKRRQMCSKNNPNFRQNPSSSGHNTASVRWQEKLATWRDDIKELFEVFPEHHSCKKCEFIVTHNFTTEDRLRPKDSNCVVCSKASFRDRNVNEREEEHLPVCSRCRQLMKHSHKHKIEDTSLHRFLCIYCAQSFEDTSLYKQHVMKHRKWLYKCLLCSAYFISRYEIGDHSRLHIRDGSYFSRKPKVKKIKSLYNLFPIVY